MAKLYHKHKKMQGGCIGFKTIRLMNHHHHMALANYCKGMGIDQHEAIRLMYLKYHEKAGRELQKNEIERGSQGIQQSWHNH